MAVFSLLTNKSYQGNMKRSFRILNECTIYFIIKFTERIVKSAFNPIAAFFLALMVNARHLFYGLSMLEKYKNTGWKKPYLIFGMCDEYFTINSAVTPPEDVDKGWFMFFVTLLNHLYWVCGATAGALLGYVIHFDTTGIEFVMTALFVVMFMGQWEEHPDHRPALIGLVIPIVCLFVFGSQNFIIPSMVLIVVCFMTLKKYLQPEVKE